MAHIAACPSSSMQNHFDGDSDNNDNDDNNIIIIIIIIIILMMMMMIIIIVIIIIIIMNILMRVFYLNLSNSIQSDAELKALKPATYNVQIITRPYYLHLL